MTAAAPIFLINLLISFIMLSCFIAAFIMAPARRYYLIYAGGFAAGISSALVEFWVGEVRLHLSSYIAAYALFGVCLLLLNIGLRMQFNGPKDRAVLAMAFGLIAPAAMIEWEMPWGSLPAIFIHNFPFAVLSLLGLYAVMRGRRRKRATDWSLVVIIGLYALHFALRPFTQLAVGGAEMAGRLASPFAVVNEFALTVLLIALAVNLAAFAVFETVADLRARTRADPLTGLLNRQGLQHVLSLLDNQKQSVPPPYIILCDLDHFKSINDTYGHVRGDAVIRSFAQTLAANLRSGDACARIGGEEFCLLLHGPNLATAYERIEYIRAQFAAQSISGLPAQIRVTASFGIAQMTTGFNFSDAYDRADHALYAAKEAGRNCVMADPDTTTPRVLPTSSASWHRQGADELWPRVAASG